MRWKGRRQSDNVEDRRSMGPKQIGLGGGIITVVVVLVGLYMGADPQTLLQIVAETAPQQNQPADPNQEAANDELSQFVKTVLADTEDVWQKLFNQMGKQYRDPKLVMFSGQVESACGYQSAAVGPFYCSRDEKVYIDLAFYRELQYKFKAPGDFAQAYVIAHEVGHHVQKLLGISDKVHAKRPSLSEAEYNELSVRLELQADFFAGVWAHHAEKSWGILEEGDIQEALTAASAIGDDAIQKKAQGYTVPESFTHGTSEQRMKWFRKGLTTGDMSQGDTFNTRDL